MIPQSYRLVCVDGACTRGTETFISLSTVPMKFYNRNPRLMNIPPITCMNHIFTRATNVRQRLKSLNRLALSSRDNTYRIWFQKKVLTPCCKWTMLWELAQCGPSWPISKDIPKSTPCLPEYIHVFHSVSQYFHPIVKPFVLYPRIPGRKLSSVITLHKLCLIVLGCWMWAHIIQIIGDVQETDVVPLLACEI